MTRKDLEVKLKKENKVCIVTSCKLPTGAVEVLVNYQELEGKAKYLLSAYDENLRLKTMQDIKLLDIIVICKGDL